MNGRQGAIQERKGIRSIKGLWDKIRGKQILRTMKLLKNVKAAILVRSAIKGTL